jgi:hypothetical protein
MYKNYYIILPLILVIIFILYSLFIYFKRQIYIQQILDHWKIMTHNGYIKLDNNGEYKGDYYLSLDDENYNTHIHFITNQEHVELKSNEFSPCPDLCYLVKRNDLHSKLYVIDQNKSPQQIVDEMLEKYNDLVF